MAKRILVIDDEPDIRRVVEFRLKKQGYEVISAGDGKEGFNLAKQEKPDLIFLDLRLPKMSGEEVCLKLKSDEELKKIPVVFLTASQVKGVADKTKEYGAQGYLIKPFAPEDLFAAVEKHIKKEAGR